MQKQHYKEIYDIQDKHWWYVGMKNINKALLKKILLHSHKPKILDAGCGPGANLKMLSEIGDALGVDLSTEALRYAKKRGKVKKADITKLPFNKESFDIVVCMDVLYHSWVKDDAKAMREFHRVLKKGGILLVREPAYEWLRGNQDKVGLTTRRFDKRSMVQAFTKQSFKIEKLTYANFFLFPVVLLVRSASLFKKQEENHSDLVMYSPLTNKILGFFLTLESKLISYVNFPFGSSLICVGRKV